MIVPVYAITYTLDMKIRSDTVVRKVGTINIVLPLGDNQEKYAIELNDEALYLWNCFVEGNTVENVIDKYCIAFSIDNITAKSDVESFIQFLKENDLLEKCYGD